MTDADRATTDLGDFTTTTRIVPIAAQAILIGVFAAYVAAALLKLIGLFTNLFFFQRLDTALVSPAGHHLGPFVILVPVASALTIGVMARYGSDPLEIVFAREVMRAPEPSGAANPLQPGDVVAYPDEPLRVIVYRMAETGRTEVAVVSRTDRARRRRDRVERSAHGADAHSRCGAAARARARRRPAPADDVRRRPGFERLMIFSAAGGELP